VTAHYGILFGAGDSFINEIHIGIHVKFKVQKQFYTFIFSAHYSDYTVTIQRPQWYLVKGFGEVVLKNEFPAPSVSQI
jgi:hypothetical protein